MRSLIIVPSLIAVVVMLCVVTCPKGHKNFGGATSVGGSSATSEAGGGSLPSGPGAYIDVGSGWTTSGLNQGNIVELMVSGSIYGPTALLDFCRESEFDSKAISASELRYCYRATSGATVADYEVGGTLYRLTRQNGNMMISESRTENGSLRISWPNHRNAFLVQINIPGPGDYVFAAAEYSVYIRR